MNVLYPDNPREQQIAERLFADFTSCDEGLIKAASIDSSDYMRRKVRDDGIARRITTPRNVGPQNLDRQLGDDRPCTIIDLQPESSGATQVPLGDIPSDAGIKANRFMATYSRLTTRRYTIDTARLLTYNMDIRNMWYDLMLKDLMDEEDRSLFAAITDNCLGTKNTATDTGACQWVDCGVFGRSALVHFAKGLPSGKGNLSPSVYLMNTVTSKDFQGFTRDEAGGDIAQNLLLNGNAQVDTVSGCRIVYTTKKDLVPNNTIFAFAPEDYFGVFYILEDVQMVSKLEHGYLLEFSAHENIANTIGNTGGVIRGDFGNTAHAW